MRPSAFLRRPRGPAPAASVAGALALLAVLPAATVRAETVTYTLDGTFPNLLTITGGEGTFGTTTRPYVAQGPGSLSVTYTGTIVADVTPTSVQLLPGTVITAGISGAWRPQSGGSTPDDPATATANYGYSVDLFSPGTPLFVAIRGLQLGFSDATTRPLAGDGTFSTAGIAGQVLAGVADVNYGNPPQSDLTFAEPIVTDAPATSGSLTLAGGTETLSLPLQFTLEVLGAVSTETFFEGTLTATRPVPEPGTVVSLLAGLGLLWLAGGRRLRPRPAASR